jgi:hypothetical protein
VFENTVKVHAPQFFAETGMSDKAFLRVTAILSGLAGHLPLKSLRGSILEYRFLSPLGLWFFFVLLANLFLGQCLLLVTILLVPHHSAAVHVTDLSITVLQIMSFNHIVSIYAVYGIYLRSGPKFLHASNLISIYDEGFRVRVKCSLSQACRKVFRVLVWTFEGIVVTGSVRINFLEANWSNYEEILCHWSPLVRALGCEQGSDVTWIQLAAPLTFLTAYLATGFSLQFILTLSKAIEDRISSIQEEFTQYPSTKLKIDTEFVLTQLLALNKIFLALKEGSGPIILVYLTSSTFTATVIVFNTSATLIQNVKDDLSYSYMAAFVSLMYLGLLSLKLVWLTDCGESLLQGVSQTFEFRYRLISPA